MAKYISELQQIEVMFQSAIEIAKKYEIIMVTSNKNLTDNTTDYSGNSVKSEFFSDQEQNLICQTLEGIGFKVKQFFDEEDFIRFISNPRKNLSKYIVLNSAQKGTKIGRKSLIPSFANASIFSAKVSFIICFRMAFGICGGVNGFFTLTALSQNTT